MQNLPGQVQGGDSRDNSPEHAGPNRIRSNLPKAQGDNQNNQWQQQQQNGGVGPGGPGLNPNPTDLNYNVSQGSSMDILTSHQHQRAANQNLNNNNINGGPVGSGSGAGLAGGGGSGSPGGGGGAGGGPDDDPQQSVENQGTEDQDENNILQQKAAGASVENEEAHAHNIKLYIDELRDVNNILSGTNNAVYTTKYTQSTFIPYNLWEQFHRIANVWFLFISILQLGTPYSPTIKYGTILPLAVIVTLTMVKDGLEDYKRHLSDKAVNSRDVYVVAKTRRELLNGEIKRGYPILRRLRWEDLRVGHVVYLEGDQPIPADMLLLCSNDAEMGTTYVETSQLDGESNLKVKNAVSDTKPDRTLDAIVKLDGMTIDVEQPSANLERFTGAIRPVGTIRPTPVDMKNFLVRGSSVRNTEFCYGVVVYTGRDTRLVMNSAATPLKRSQIEARVNTYLSFILFLMMTMIVFSYLPRDGSMNEDQIEYYLQGADETDRAAFGRFLIFLILYNNLVPVSLYISLDFVKSGQAYFMQLDENFRWRPKGGRETVTVSCRTTTLNDDLGQIDYIFSDKTGTLTENQMIFRVCSAGGKIFGKTDVLNPSAENDRTIDAIFDEKNGPVSAGGTSSINQFGSKKSQNQLLTALTSTLTNNQNTANKDNHTASSKLTIAEGGSGGHDPSKSVDARGSQNLLINTKELFAYGVKEITEELQDFLECVLVCHGANAVKRQKKELAKRFFLNAVPTEIGPIPRDFFGGGQLPAAGIGKHMTIDELEAQYRVEASSPDEEALLLGISALGYKVLERSYMELTVLKNGAIQRWEILGQHEFTSDRKRMSMVVRELHSGLLDPNLTSDPTGFGSSSRNVEDQGLMMGMDFDQDDLNNMNDQKGTGNDNEISESEEDAPDSEHDVTNASQTQDDNTNDPENAHKQKRKSNVNENENASSSSSSKSKASDQMSEEPDMNTALEQVYAEASMAIRSSFDQKQQSILQQNNNNAITAAQSGSKTKSGLKAPKNKDDDGRLTNGGEGKDSAMGNSNKGTKVATLEKKKKTKVNMNQESKVILFMKGADVVMLERANLKLTKKSTLEGIQRHVSEFSTVGLRTLVMGKRILNKDEADDYIDKYERAKSALVNREEKLDAVAEDFERNLQLLGCSGLEDRIQAGVSDTVRTILHGGVKVWMLTGDKQETAINVGYSIQLFEQRYKIFVFNVPQEKRGNRTDEKINQIFEQHARAVQEAHDRNGSSLEYGLVIDGTTLSVMMTAKHNIIRRFILICSDAKAVIACRITPRQKAALVDLIKNNLSPSPITLAIGDGANDVAMIRTAHVGIGITGNEGRQAVSASDYSMGQFRFLVNLLFTHGRRNYNRIAIVILFSFYKNACLIAPQWHFNLQNGFSGASLYYTYLLAGYNLFWTSIPIIILGFFDVDLPELACLHVPILYQQGVFRKSLSYTIFVQWILEGLALGTFLFWFHYEIFFDGGVGEDFNLDYLSFGSGSVTSRQKYVMQGTSSFIWGASRMWILNVLSVAMFFSIDYFWSCIKPLIFQSPVTILQQFLPECLGTDAIPANSHIENPAIKAHMHKLAVKIKHPSVKKSNTKLASAQEYTPPRDIIEFWNGWSGLHRFYQKYEFLQISKKFILKENLSVISVSNSSDSQNKMTLDNIGSNFIVKCLGCLFPSLYSSSSSSSSAAHRKSARVSPHPGAATPGAGAGSVVVNTQQQPLSIIPSQSGPLDKNTTKLNMPNQQVHLVSAQQTHLVSTKVSPKGAGASTIPGPGIGLPKQQSDAKGLGLNNQQRSQLKSNTQQQQTQIAAYQQQQSQGVRGPPVGPNGADQQGTSDDSKQNKRTSMDGFDDKIYPVSLRFKDSLKEHHYIMLFAKRNTPYVRKLFDFGCVALITYLAYELTVGITKATESQGQIRLFFSGFVIVLIRIFHGFTKIGTKVGVGMVCWNLPKIYDQYRFFRILGRYVIDYFHYSKHASVRNGRV